MEEADVQLAAPIIANLFPAKVQDPAGAIVRSDVRVVLTPEWMVLYESVTTPTGRKRVRTAMKVRSANVRPHAKKAGAWTVTDDTGQEWTVSRSSGCGCGDPLRSMPSPAPLDL